MDVVLAGLNDTPSGSLLGLFLIACGEGTLGEEEFILLAWVLKSVLLEVSLRYLKKVQFDCCWPWMRLPSSAGLDLRSKRLRQALEH